MLQEPFYTLSVSCYNERATIAEVLGLAESDSRVVFGPLPEDDPARRRPDITLAARELGWAPEVPLEEGLRKTIDYFRGVL